MYCVESISSHDRALPFLRIPTTEKNAPLVVFLHGFPSNVFDWDFQIEALRDRFDIIVPVLQDTTLKGWYEDVLSIISHARTSQRQKVYIIAHDLGCFLGAQLASLGSLSLAGLIHINGLDMAQFTSRRYSLSQWCKSFYVLLAQLKPIRLLVAKMFPAFFLKLIYDIGAVKTADQMRSTNPRTALGGIAIYQDLLREAIVTSQQHIAKIQTPTLFLWGKDDAFLNIPTMSEVHRHYEQATVRLLRGGHWVLRSDAPHVNRILLKTLSAWEQGHE